MKSAFAYRHFAVLLFASQLLMLPALAGTQPWQVNLQEIAGYTPLEIKWSYSESYGSGNISMAALYNNGSENVIDLYSLNASDTGLSIESHWPNVASGQVFGLGQPCPFSGGIAFPFIQDFNVRAIRRDMMGVGVIDVDTSATNHTNTDCVGVDSGMWLAAQNFDIGRIDYFSSSDALSWSLGFSYQPSGGSVIGPFGGGFRPTTGGFIMGPDYFLGTTYQRASGELEAVALGLDGSVAGVVGFDEFASHGSFINNGYLKECAGLVPGAWPYGICNGGTALAFGLIDLNTGEPNFQMLNSINPGSHLGFQGVSLSHHSSGDDSFLHAFSSRHVRRIFNTVSGTATLEEVPDYPFRDVGGPVASLFGVDRLFVAAAGFGGDTTGEPRLMVATMDPALIEGQPLGGTGGGTGAPAVSVPGLQGVAMIVLGLLLAVLALFSLNRRMRPGS